MASWELVVISMANWTDFCKASRVRWSTGSTDWMSILVMFRLLAGKVNLFRILWLSSMPNTEVRMIFAEFCRGNWFILANFFSYPLKNLSFNFVTFFEGGRSWFKSKFLFQIFLKVKLRKKKIQLSLLPLIVTNKSWSCLKWTSDLFYTFKNFGDCHLKSV